MKDIVIVGAGGHSREIAHLIEEINLKENKWNILGFIDKNKKNIGKINGNYKIIADESYFEKNEQAISVVIAIGNGSIIKNIVEKLKKYNHISYPNIIHPSVKKYFREIVIKHGNVICDGNVFTSNIEIGSFNSINRCCNISHDVIVEDYCIINPSVNISGAVKINTGAFLGVSSTILQYLNIGKGSIIGAGSVVTKDVKDSTTVVGIPARQIK